MQTLYDEEEIYAFEERIGICQDSGIPYRKAEPLAYASIKNMRKAGAHTPAKEKPDEK